MLCNNVIAGLLMDRKRKPKCCSPKPDIDKRELLTLDEASSLESMFKMLANGTRLRILHALVRENELCVGDIAENIGMKPQAVSNQLIRLSDRGIVDSHRNGLEIRYRIIDPCVVELLDRGWCLVDDSAKRALKKRKL